MAFAFTGPISGSFSIVDWSAVLIFIFVPEASFAAADLVVFAVLVTSEEAAAVVATADVLAVAAVVATDVFAAPASGLFDISSAATSAVVTASHP